MVSKVEKVTDMEPSYQDEQQNGGFSKEKAFEKTRARINQSEKNNGISINKSMKQNLLPTHTNQTFLESCNSIFRSLIVPQDENLKKRWFNDENNISINELITFYFFRSILTFFYFMFSIFALFEYSITRTKIKFLSMAYKSNDDPSIINADVNKLPKIPHKLATILNYKSEQEEGGGIEGLCNDGSLVAAWCVSSGIPHLTIYETNGILKKSIPEFSDAIYKKFEAYFGMENVPQFMIKIPHLNITYYGINGGLYDSKGKKINKINENDNNKDINSSGTINIDIDNEEFQIEINLLGKVDGRQTIVELTKVMAQMVKSGDMKKSDVTINFIDHELKQLVGEEPDLIVMFQPYLDLQGYPPWHIRLSEMYWEPENDQVSYVVFLRALQKYSTCKVNIGR